VAQREYIQKNGMAIQEANNRRASAKEACQLLWLFESGEAAFIRMLEENSHACGMPREAIQQARGEYTKASRIRKQVCNAAASRSLGLPDPLWDLPEIGKAEDYDYNCDLCGKTGDFGLPSMPGR
jgi:hypothetical protein